MNTVFEKLKRSILEGRAIHGYLITGSDPHETEELMLCCAALLLFGNENTEALQFSPDFFLLDGTVRIDDVREIRREVNKTTFSSTNRVVIIKNAHLLNDFSINAMLKMLEEPPEGTYFFLSGIEQRILPTIRSRCMTIRLGCGSADSAVRALEVKGAPHPEAINLSLQADGDRELALKLFQDDAFRKLRESALKAFFSCLNGGLPFSFGKELNKDRAAANASIVFMLNACHDALLIKSGALGGSGLSAADFRAELDEISERFTFSGIRSIITVLTDTCERLNSNAGIGPLIDRMIVELSGIASKQ